jgi:tRNA-dihydrouridine synthase C
MRPSPLTMITPDRPAVVLAPMDGLTDAPMRAVQGEIGDYTFSVAEFVRISANVPSRPVFVRSVPELENGGVTTSGLPVYVQILGGDPERMAASAVVACAAGAASIDINFGCPAPTVNNHDGGASLLKHPLRIRNIVAAVRAAVPRHIPVSAKLRLGWDSTDAIFENAERAAEGGASWITIHARTREQGYRPPVRYGPIGIVRERLGIPVVANGDIWTMEAFRQCRDETGCSHFMLGRGGIADPSLSHRIAAELGIASGHATDEDDLPIDWRPHLLRLIERSDAPPMRASRYLVCRLKQWLNIASLCGTFSAFDAVKRVDTVEALFAGLDDVYRPSRPSGSFAGTARLSHALAEKVAL